MKDDLPAKLRRAAIAQPDGSALERWERLAAGEADEAERRELEALAGEDGDPDAMRALAPLDDAWLARTTARIEAEHAGGDAEVRPLARKGNANGRRVGLVASAAAVLALAAAVTLRLAPRPTDGDLPTFALRIEGDERAVRGAAPLPPGEPPAFRQGAVVRILLRPARDFSGPLGMSAAIVDHGVAREWTPPVEISPAGVVKIEGDAALLFAGEPGDRAITIALGRPDRLPKSADDVVHAEPKPGVAVLHTTVRWLGAGTPSAAP